MRKQTLKRFIIEPAFVFSFIYKLKSATSLGSFQHKQFLRYETSHVKNTSCAFLNLKYINMDEEGKLVWTVTGISFIFAGIKADSVTFATQTPLYQCQGWNIFSLMIVSKKLPHKIQFFIMLYLRCLKRSICWERLWANVSSFQIASFPVVRLYFLPLYFGESTTRTWSLHAPGTKCDVSVTSHKQAFYLHLIADHNLYAGSWQLLSIWTWSLWTV